MPSSNQEPNFTELRHSMVELIELYVHMSSERIEKDRLDTRVLEAMDRVPRHAFVPDELQEFAYADSPLPIGCGKTISQPFMVALMTDLLDVHRQHRVLEVGTGLGYQAAILAELTEQVYTVEIIEELARDGEHRLAGAGYDTVRFRVGDGSQGWPDYAPFDRIMVTAAPELLPSMLLHQLAPGGRMVIPAGLEDEQQLLTVDKDGSGRITTRDILPVRFSRLITSH